MKKIFLILLLVFLLVGFFIIVRKINIQKSPEAKIRGLILPHHELAKELLHSSFKRVKESFNPDVIVIFGANHYFPEGETFTTTEEIKNEFKLESVLGDDKRIQNEHSIQTLVPYLTEYFPDAKLIPVIVSENYLSLKNLNNFVTIFIKNFKVEKTLFIASVDFAHNVSLEEGLNKNKESINNISNFNYVEILKYKDDHMDSPASIATLLLIMQELGAHNWETWYSSHGALITNKLDLSGTSYVIGSFVER